MYTLLFRTKYDAFCFTPFVKTIEEAMKLYLNYIWWGYKAVQILDSIGCTVWQTETPVIHSINNPHPTEDLPF